MYEYQIKAILVRTDVSKETALITIYSDEKLTAEQIKKKIYKQEVDSQILLSNEPTYVEYDIDYIEYIYEKNRNTKELI